MKQQKMMTVLNEMNKIFVQLITSFTTYRFKNLGTKQQFMTQNRID